MTRRPAADVAAECPPWCGVDHTKDIPFHAYCTGEVRGPGGSIGVMLTRCETYDGIELAYYPVDCEPSIAFLDGDGTRQLRDCLDRAVKALGVA